MGELQYAVNQDKQSAGLPGVYKLGGWYATTDFADQRFGLDPAGDVVSLADPAVAGPLNHRGNWGIYGVADQMVWRAGKQSLNLFARGGFSPSDRNLVSFYIDGGAGFKGPLPGRDDDVLTFGVAYAKISRDAAALDQDMLAFNGPPYADPRLRAGVRAQLRGADRAVVDAAAGPAIHRASRRQCRTRTIRRSRSATPSSPAFAAPSSSSRLASATPSRTARKRLNNWSQSSGATDADHAHIAADAEAHPLHQPDRIAAQVLGGGADLEAGKAAEPHGFRRRHGRAR